MTNTVGMVLLIAVFLFQAWLLWKLLAAPPVVVDRPVPVETVREIVREVPGPRLVRPRRPMEIRLMSGSGRRELERITIDAGERRPTISRPNPDGTVSVYAASHEDGEGWVYRRVGVERG